MHAVHWKDRTQKLRQKSPSAHHCTTLSCCIFATKARTNNREKKRVKWQYLLHTSLQHGELGPLTAEIRWWVWGTPENFNGFCILASLLQQRQSTRSTKLYMIFGHLLHWYTIYAFLGALVPMKFRRLQNSLWVQDCVLINWQCYCTALEHWPQPKIAAWYKEWNYGTFTKTATYVQDRHHVEHQPTFLYFIRN